ncbi:MAG: hypothetical protein HOB79_03685 [Rhodospirillaceae bacterium]|jgi:hypothetical protein|nr:hypothetical protein [Rhodospirillales bacterium]MBT3906397.1 hypothetical protein [Rhodospirillaceae bacterium]MBT4700151.1 hypothetical protein [Rhodospirillaceae bacterium]MBT5032972.1 hypothetical protein [Rhodospirillaceae bacterium]MBT6219759.1 hypothetical protein [Rhodospirillaceae bacterium]
MFSQITWTNQIETQIREFAKSIRIAAKQMLASQTTDARKLISSSENTDVSSFKGIL